MIREHFLENSMRELRRLKRLAERAMAQVDDEQLFRSLDGESNSIALTAKHMAGNMRSRWTDFLTTDGEKPDRQRDLEFELEPQDSRESVEAAWEEGWRITLEAIGDLGWRDLEMSVTIRGEAHTVVEAIQRQLTHYAYHVGQIVLLARHFAGGGWESLSIPKRKPAGGEPG